MVARRVAHQGTVHLAGHRLFPVAGRADLVDSVVRAVVLVEVEGSPTQCLAAQRHQRLSGQVTNTHGVSGRWFVG